MNRRARAMGLTCTRFSSPERHPRRGQPLVRGRPRGAGARGAADAAAGAHRAPPRAVLPFPIKGGRLYLYNHNPLLRAGYRGTTGVKTGYTEAAGPLPRGHRAARRAAARRGPAALARPGPAGAAAARPRFRCQPLTPRARAP